MRGGSRWYALYGEIIDGRTVPAAGESAHAAYAQGRYALTAVWSQKGCEGVRERASLFSGGIVSRLSLPSAFEVAVTERVVRVLEAPMRPESLQ